MNKNVKLSNFAFPLYLNGFNCRNSRMQSRLRATSNFQEIHALQTPHEIKYGLGQGFSNRYAKLWLLVRGSAMLVRKIKPQHSITKCHKFHFGNFRIKK